MKLKSALLSLIGICALVCPSAAQSPDETVCTRLRAEARSATHQLRPPYIVVSVENGGLQLPNDGHPLAYCIVLSIYPHHGTGKVVFDSAVRLRWSELEPPHFTIRRRLPTATGIGQQWASSSSCPAIGRVIVDLLSLDPPKHGMLGITPLPTIWVDGDIYHFEQPDLSYSAFQPAPLGVWFQEAEEALSTCWSDTPPEAD